MNRFPIPAPLDLDLNLQVGQVFRFRKTAAGWEGWDDADYYRFDDSEVESTATPADLARLFRLDMDLEQLHAELIRRGSELEPLIAQFPHLRLMRPRCAREMLFTFLCTANNHLPRITAMVDRMARLSASGFPTLAQLGAVSEADWRTAGFGYRGRTLPLVVREIESRGGEAWFSTLRPKSYAAVVEELESLPGVGPKLADCIALYAFDRTEAAPVDTHLWQAYVEVYGATGTLTDRTKREVGDALRDRFGELAGFAQQFLFVAHLRGRIQ